jgi:hypothetical protein
VLQAGLVRSRRLGELWVEPARGVTRAHPEEQHPHVLYRRSATLSPTKKRRKKKRASEKNCGTRGELYLNQHLVLLVVIFAIISINNLL